jgi:hypothetical protein
MRDEPLRIRREIGLERGDNRREHSVDSFGPPFMFYHAINTQLSTLSHQLSPVFAFLLLSVIATKIAIAMGQIRFRRNVPVNAAANDS